MTKREIVKALYGFGPSCVNSPHLNNVHHVDSFIINALETTMAMCVQNLGLYWL